MKKLSTAVHQFLVSEDGPTAVEYALMVGLIAVAIIGAVTALGGALNTKFGEIEAGISAAGQ